ncbi:hypothetical protein AMELA_G00167860, partial [Ameiurus melas]
MNCCDVHNSNHTLSQCYEYITETHRTGLNAESESELSFHTDTFQFVEQGTSDDNLTFDDEVNVELNIEEGTKLQNSTNTGDSPLYRNAPISVAESLLLIMPFANRHKITGKALSDLLTLITLHCPSDIQTECFQNLMKFQKFFDNSSSLLLHKYCSTCLMSVESTDTHCKYRYIFKMSWKFVFVMDKHIKFITMRTMYLSFFIH